MRSPVTTTRNSRNLVIAAPLSNVPANCEKINELKKNVESLVQEKVHYIVTHCRPGGCRENYCCISFHPKSANDYIRYMLLMFIFILKILLINIYSIYKRKCTIILNGSIFMPIICILHIMGCKVYILELGSWDDVAYWKTYYIYGNKFAFLVKNITKRIKIISYIISNFIIINSHNIMQELYRFSSKIKISIQKINIKCYFSKSFNSDRNLILYVGRLEYEKGIDIFLKICLKIFKYNILREKIKCIIAGQGQLSNIIISITKKVKYIEYVGHIYGRDLANLYSRALILVIPSRTEGLPSVLLEAISCGVPYILVNSQIEKNIILLQKYINNNNTHIIFFNNINEAIDIIKNIIKDIR